MMQPILETLIEVWTWVCIVLMALIVPLPLLPGYPWPERPEEGDQ